MEKENSQMNLVLWKNALFVKVMIYLLNR